jgi:hypothetical protein
MQKQDLSRVLVTYAALADRFERGGNHFDALAPFFSSIARDSVGKLFDPKEFAREASARFGLFIPLVVVEAMVPNLEAAGIVANEGKSANGKGTPIYRYCVGANGDLDDEGKVEVTAVLYEFRDYARHQSADLKKLSDDDLDQAFFDRLLHIESLRILRRRDNQLQAKSTSSTLTRPAQPETNVEESVTDFVVARYLLECRDKTPETFAILEKIAMANMMAEAIVSFREPIVAEDHFRDTKVFVDGPLLLDMLGVNAGFEEYGAEFEKLLVDSGCKRMTFTHYIDETERIIDAKLAAYSSNNALAHYSSDSPKVKDMVRRVARNVAPTLKSLFDLDHVDGYIRASAEDDKRLRNAMAGWAREDAKEADIKSVYSIFEQQTLGKIANRVAEVPAIFVSKNPQLVHIVNSYYFNRLVEIKRATASGTKHLAPIALTEKQFAGIVWLCTGGSVGELSRARLVANCAAAVAPRRDVAVRAFNCLLEIDEQKAKIFKSIIVDQRVERTLNDRAFGVPAIITDANIEEIYEACRRETAAEVSQAAEEEAAKLKAELSSANERVSQLETDLASQHRVVAEKEFDRLRYCGAAGAAAYWAVTVAIVVCLSVLTGFLLYQFGVPLAKWMFGPTPTPAEENLAYALPGLMVLSALSWTLPDLLFGRLRDWCARNAFRKAAIGFRVGHLVKTVTFLPSRGIVLRDAPMKIPGVSARSAAHADSSQAVD